MFNFFCRLLPLPTATTACFLAACCCSRVSSFWKSRTRPPGISTPPVSPSLRLYPCSCVVKKLFVFLCVCARVCVCCDGCCVCKLLGGGAFSQLSPRIASVGTRGRRKYRGYQSATNPTSRQISAHSLVTIHPDLGLCDLVECNMGHIRLGFLVAYDVLRRPCVGRELSGEGKSSHRRSVVVAAFNEVCFHPSLECLGASE